MKEYIKELFLDLIKYDTTSDPNSKTSPSTESQFFFSELLAGRLAELELEDVKADSNGIVTALLPSNGGNENIGFISHMDTSPDFSGKNIVPIIKENYDGGNIERRGPVLSPDEFPHLYKYRGKTLICSDGTTLLGADDKAGIAEIIAAVKYVKEHPEIKHGNIHIAFTPDEEIGLGTANFDVEAFGCDYAYTVDGGELGEISYENFNAAQAVITIRGKSVHPGSAKGVMINAALVASRFIASLPEEQTPEQTDGHEGFFHLLNIKADVAKAELTYIIRDFDTIDFKKKKTLLTTLVNNFNRKYGKEIVTVDMHDQYYNMADIINKTPKIVNKAVNAIIKAGVKPLILPIRGGTDGAMLSYKGLPCPNIFTGGHNFHGPYEYICLESMEKAAQTIVNIISEEENQ